MSIVTGFVCCDAEGCTERAPYDGLTLPQGWLQVDLAHICPVHGALADGYRQLIAVWEQTNSR